MPNNTINPSPFLNSHGVSIFCLFLFFFLFNGVSAVASQEDEEADAYDEVAVSRNSEISLDNDDPQFQFYILQRYDVFSNMSILNSDHFAIYTQWNGIMLQDLTLEQQKEQIKITPPDHSDEDESIPEWQYADFVADFGNLLEKHMPRNFLHFVLDCDQILAPLTQSLQKESGLYLNPSAETISLYDIGAIITILVGIILIIGGLIFLLIPLFYNPDNYVNNLYEYNIRV